MHKKRRKKKGLGALLAAVSILAVSTCALILILIFTGKGKEEPEEIVQENIKEKVESLSLNDTVSENDEEKPAPVEIERGDLKDSGIPEEAMDLIDEIITSDIDHGFSSAQLSVVKDGKLVYENAWGNIKTYDESGNKVDSPAVTNDTLYDLASNTKMYSVNYALQYLATRGEVDLDAKIVDILGSGFADDVVDIKYVDCPATDIETQKEWKSKLTIRDLLKHEGGFPPGPHYYSNIYDNASRDIVTDEANVNELYVGTGADEKAREDVLKMIFKTPLMYEPGTDTVYSDVDYMILCFVVEKLTGKGMDEYLKETFFEPMGLKHITYNPLENGFEKEDCAATELMGNTRDGQLIYSGVRTYMLQGEVHDPNAYYCMDGVSGHAGLFSNATDLAILASLMLDGEYNGEKYFSKEVINEFTAPKSSDNAEYGLGWWRQADHKRDRYFGTKAAANVFGHQGFSGTLTVIDPDKDLVIVFLTNKIHSNVLKGKENLNNYYGNYYVTGRLGFVSEIILSGIEINTLSDEGSKKEKWNELIKTMTMEAKERANKGRGHPSYRAYVSIADVYNKGKLERLDKNGDIILADELTDEYLPLLSGKKVGVFSNHTGIVGDDTELNIHILDMLVDNGVNVTCGFAPEHGFRGSADAGENVGDSKDETGVTIRSLYGSNKQTALVEGMKEVDVLLVDIQDVGVRYYTYYITLCDLMEEAAKTGKEVIILDRPNPNGSYVDGPVLKSGFESGIGKIPIPVVYGMTIGELAKMVKGEGYLSTDLSNMKLTVIPCKNYSHNKKHELPVAPSPNLKDMKAIYIYPSTCYFENTVVSVARGTDAPFVTYGSPFFAGMPGYEYQFTPKSMEGAKSPAYEGETCFGKDLRGKSDDEIINAHIDLSYLIEAYLNIRSTYPDLSFFGSPDENGRYWIDKLFGTDSVRVMIESGYTAEEIKASWAQEVEDFKAKRKAYLLYE